MTRARTYRSGRPALTRTMAVTASAFGLALAATLTVGSAAPEPAAAFNPSSVRLSLSRVATGLSAPVGITSARDASGRLFVVEQAGRIRILKGSTVLATPFLDIHTRVSCCGERGLLGLAFHPSYRTNGKFYVNYTDLYGNTVIAEYHRSTTSANRASTVQRVLMHVWQPYANHNGGGLAFGPDGFLYIALGDGGGRGDPGNRAQRVDTLLGKMLRIDVNHRTSTLPYAIPSSNPYVGRYGYDQIWSIGLRNPWRFSFDRASGDLWIGDVGQDRYEEIDRARRSSGGGRGANFGWRVMEARACYLPATGCNTSGKTLPLTYYSHTYGCAVIGGYVYRGPAYPLLHGAYLFGDYCSGRIWAVDAGGGTQYPHQMLDTSLTISSFGEGETGELYLTDLRGGAVYRLRA